MVIKTRLHRLFLLLMLSSATGCAHKKIAANLPTLLIEPSCITKPVEIEHCYDLKSVPPKCSGPAKVDYKLGCESVEIPKEKNQ